MRHHRLRQPEQVRVVCATHVEAASGRGQVQQHAQVAEPQVGIDQQRLERIERGKSGSQIGGDGALARATFDREHHRELRTEVIGQFERAGLNGWQLVWRGQIEAGGQNQRLDAQGEHRCGQRLARVFFDAATLGPSKRAGLAVGRQQHEQR